MTIQSQGGHARARSLSAFQRTAISRKAANARWNNPRSTFKIMDKHVVIENGAGKCLHCGDIHPFETPIPIDDFVAETKAFINRHKDCPPRPTPAKAPEKIYPEKD